MNFSTFEQYVQFTVYAMIVYSLAVTFMIAVAAKICFIRNIHRADSQSAQVMPNGVLTARALVCPDAISPGALEMCVMQVNKRRAFAWQNMLNTSRILDRFYRLKPEEQKLAPLQYLKSAISAQEAAMKSQREEDYLGMFEHSVKAFKAIEQVQIHLLQKHGVYCLLSGQSLPL